jgi:hypothetical protein
MRKWTGMFAAATLAGLCLAHAGAGRALAADAKADAQRKLMAYRAARADAIRRLAERIRGLRITSETAVRDFVAESDTVRTALDAFLAGVRETGKPRYLADGTCELEMAVTIEQLVANLQQIHRRYYKGSRVRVQDFTKMTVTNRVKVIKETGVGALREEFDEPELIEVKPGQRTVSFSRIPSKARRFWAAHCTARGRLMAERAARVEAMRRLAERIKGVHVTSQTTVQDFVAESDDVNVDMRTFLKGAREVGVRYHDDELIVEVEMQVKLRTIYASLKSWSRAHLKGDRVRLQQLERLIVKAEERIIRETGMGVPPDRYMKDATDEMRQTAAVARITPPWATQSLKEPGTAALDAGNPDKAQAKLMAFRAAELDGRRKLAERVSGLRISSRTSVKDFVANSDRIGTALLVFQQGAYPLGDSRTLLDDGTARVEVIIELKPLWNVILHYQKTLKIKIE